MIKLSVTNKILGEVYCLVSFPNQAMRIIEGTPNTHPIDIESLRRIYEGIKTGNMVLTDYLYSNNMIKNVEAHLENIKMETEHYKEHDEFVHLKTENDRKTYEKLMTMIPELRKWIDDSTSSIKKVDSYLVDLEKLLKTTTADPKYIEISQKVKHSTFLTMKGEVIVPLTRMFVYHTNTDGSLYTIMKNVFSKLEVSYFNKIVLKKLLENYITGYPLRKPYIGKSRFILLEPEHITVTMDSDMKTITDLFCPWLFASKDYNSILHFDMEFKTEDRGIEVGMNGEPYSFILMDFEKEISFEKTTVEPYFKVHRNVLWIRECKMMISILIRLGFGAYKNSTNIRYEYLISDIVDKFIIILEEGIVLDYNKVYKFLSNEIKQHDMEYPEEDCLELVCKILEVLASDRGSEYHEVVITHSDDESIPIDAPVKFSISIKIDFERDVVEILNIVNQYV